MRPSLSDLMKILDLRPLQPEGGFFVETYRTAEKIDARQFGLGHGGTRSLSTAIYYLLTPESFSAIHKVPGDEVFHFYAGDPVEMLELFPDGSSGVTTLGPDVRVGMKFQYLVKGGVWQGARLAAGGGYALLGTTMAPGFDYADFSKGSAEELAARYPAHAGLIWELLRS